MNDTAGCILGIDYGTRRIGIAIGDRAIGHARPLCCIENRHGTPDWNAFDTLLERWQPAALVLGWPLTDDGTEQPITAHVRGFGKRLQARYPALDIHRVNEGYSSNAAQRELAALRASGQRRKRTGKSDVDTLAAAIILQDWFDTRSS